MRHRQKVLWNCCRGAGLPKPSTTEELIGLGTGVDDAEKDREFSQRISDIKDTFGTPHGRRTLLHIISNTFQHDSPMTGNSQTYYNLGAMDFGRAVMDIIAIADFDTYQWITAQRANNLREKYLDRIIENAGKRD